MTGQQHDVQPMRFGVRLPTYCFDDQSPQLGMLQDFARVAEQLCFDSVWAADHLMVAEPSYHVSFADPLLVLAAVAGVTERVQLGTTILNLPLRHPVLVAKEAATLDVLCDGRFALGVGAGWMQAEFDALGIPYTQRGRRCDEYLSVLTRLWRGEPVTFAGNFVTLDSFKLRPTPLRPGGPVLCVGGGSAVPPAYASPANSGAGTSQSVPSKVERVLRRIARFADEWHAPSVSNPALLQQDWARIETYAREAGRNPEEISRVQTSYVVLAPESVAKGRFERVMGKDFDSYIKRGSFLFGEPDEIVEVLLERQRLGFSRMILTPLDFEVDQLADWVESFVEPFYRRLGTTHSIARRAPRNSNVSSTAR